jgi:hypothetical protein
LKSKQNEEQWTKIKCKLDVGRHGGWVW